MTRIAALFESVRLIRTFLLLRETQLLLLRAIFNRNGHGKEAFMGGREQRWGSVPWLSRYIGFAANVAGVGGQLSIY
jgi:hypothetical protein